MDLLKAELERKRKQNELIKEKLSLESDQAASKKKFLKQSDLIRIREEEAIEAQRALDLERERKRQQQQSEHERILETMKPREEKSSAQPISVQTIDYSKLSVREIQMRLRRYGEPITLFGESHEDRLLRFERINQHRQLAADEADDDFKLTTVGHDTENAFLDKQTKQKKSHSLDGDDDDEDQEKDEDDDEDEDRALNSTVGINSSMGERKEKNSDNEETETHPTHSHDPAAGDDRDDEDEGDFEFRLNHMAQRIDKDGNVILFSTHPKYASTKEKIILKFFRTLLKAWEYDLNERTPVEKISAKGKMETKTQKQCKDYIRPLFKLCKKKELNPAILHHLIEIVKFAENGNFRAANDEYLRAAIGNSAWPIGLTMVGIHERSGRERISTSKVAHVMNNEQQRKYFTSVKRLLTYSQKKRVDVPPSMKVN